MNIDQRDNIQIESVKRKVKRLHSLLKQYVPDIKLGHCYEIYSKIEGYKSWNAMSAILKGEESSPLNAERIVKAALREFGSEDAAFNWLNSANTELAGKKPVELWGTDEGGREIIRVLGMRMFAESPMH